jgi:hypothetical protein
MKTYDNGCFYTVTMSAREVAEFNSSWPCSTIPERPIWFQFHKSSGDLVDTSNNLRDVDGYELSALAEDCRNYGAKKLLSATRKGVAA